MTKPAPVLHLDWIQMQIKWCNHLDPFWHSKYKVKKLDFGTRHFKVVEEVYIGTARIATVTSKPHSGILDEHAIIVKFDNWVCYETDMRNIISDFLVLNKFQFVSFSRVDFCADFNRFDNNMHPQKFMKSYLSRRLLRLGKTNNVAAHFKQAKNEHFFKGLKFGSNLSEVTAYIYNKTLEMETVKWKPWIFQSWIKGGLNVKEHIYRLEFSMKSGGSLICNRDTGEVDLFLSLELLEWKCMHDSFFVLYEKYFQFVWNDGQVRKDRMRKLKLFSYIPWNEILVKSVNMRAADRALKIFIKKLHEMNNELRGRDFYMNVYMEQYKDTLIKDSSLESWAMYKGFNNNT